MRRDRKGREIMRCGACGRSVKVRKYAPGDLPVFPGGLVYHPECMEVSVVEIPTGRKGR